MKSFLITLQFLTIIPIKIRYIDEKKISRAIIYFPLVGLLLGLILAGVNKFLLFLNFEPLFINIVLIVLLIVLTGGIHLDGLADTADALLSRKNKEEMLEIMRDSHIGVMGVLSLVCVILLKIAFLSSIADSLKTTALLLMCVLGRGSIVPVMFSFPYARKEGKAGAFIRGMNLQIFIFCAIEVSVCAFLIWHIKGLIALLIVSACAYAIGKSVSKKIGGITGDTLGATIELVETLTLLSVYIAQGVIYCLVK